MNQDLTNQLVKHIWTNFGLTGERQVSIASAPFLTEFTIEYEYEDWEKSIVKANVWMAETISNTTKFIIAYADFGEDDAIIISIDGCPTYGCYRNGYKDCIAFDLKNKSWIPADTYIQLTFTAGLETFKDLMLTFGSCKNQKPVYDKLISFIKYIDELENI